jgi:metallophosphoesterase superfamily enzyme
MDKIYELKPDFIIWTGDNSAHNSKNSSQEENYEATIIIKDMLDERFNFSIPIYPVLGNHEVFPADAYIGTEIEMLEEYARTHGYRNFRHFTDI